MSRSLTNLMIRPADRLGVRFDGARRAERSPALRPMAKPRALWLRLRNTPVLRMLQIEEGLFRADARSWFITNAWDMPAAGDEPGLAAAHAAAQSIVLGISGKPAEMLHGSEVRARGVPVIRRFSGGGTIVSDANTLFAAFICAADAEPDVSAYPEPILAWTAGVYAAALLDCGAPNFAVRANDYCLSTPEGDLKFGGNAQSISGKRWLHHTSVLWAYEARRMELLRMPKRQPDYRAQRPHASFVRGLGAVLPCRRQFGDALARAIAQRWELVPASLEEAEEAIGRPHRKVTRVLSPDEVG